MVKVADRMRWGFAPAWVRFRPYLNAKFISVLQRVAVCCSVLQCAAVCCSVLQCAAVCCSRLCIKIHALISRGGIVVAGRLNFRRGPLPFFSCASPCLLQVVLPSL